ncbi:MAG: hypothetical protein IT369_15995 [Candidatus Latescibacteria bacterium]|nr:hypothetical protein [Candidatus Latescibacterota bacterium]
MGSPVPAPDLIDLGRFCLGLVLIGGLRVLAQMSRRPGAEFWAPLMAPRLHYGLAGVLSGYTFLPQLAPAFAALLAIVLVFCGAWVGVAAGCSFDLRREYQHRFLGLLLEGGQAGLAMAAVLLAAFLVNHFPAAGSIYLNGAALEVVCGICMVGISAAGAEQQANRPPLAALCGALLAALGISQLHGSPFPLLSSPLVPRGLIVDGQLGKLLFGSMLGCGIGVLADLATRDEHPLAVRCYLVAGVVLLGGGIAAALGLEPLWVGLLAGAWLINATLRRLDILETISQSYSFAQSGLLFGGGWFLGEALLAGGTNLGVFAWAALLVLVLRLAARLSSRLEVRYVPAERPHRGHRPVPAGALDLDDVGLALAASLLRILPSEAGIALMGAVAAGQLCLRLIGWWSRRWRPPAPAPLL